MTKKPFTVGQRVWSPCFGWGAVKDIKTENEFPVYVEFEDEEESFTSDGKLWDYHLHPTLFHDEVSPWPDPNPPLPKIKVDQAVWVRDAPDQEWNVRHFKGFEGTRIQVYAAGCRSKLGSSAYSTWNEYRLDDPYK